MIEFPYNWELGEHIVEPPMPFGEGLTSQIIESGEPLLEDSAGAADDRPVVGTPSKSYLGVPIWVGDRAIGVISVQSTREEGRYGEDDTRLLATLAANVGVAIQNARLFAEIGRQKEYFESLVGISPVAVIEMDADENRDRLEPGRRRALRLLAGGGDRAPDRRPRLRRGASPTRAARPPREAVASGRAHRITRRTRKDGTPVDVELMLVPLTVDGRARRLPRHLPRHHRAPAGPRGGRGGDAGEERVPGDDEPRDPDADECRDRHDRPAARHRADAGAAGVRRGRPLERRRAPARDRRHPRLLEDRGREARAGARAVRSPGVRRQRARHGRAARGGEEPRARLPRRRRRPGRDRRRRGAAAPGAPQPALERGQVHGAGRGRGRPRRGARGRRVAPRPPGRPRHRDRDPARPHGQPLRVVQPGRRVDDAPLRRHGPRARDLQAPRRADGRPALGRERGRQGLLLPHPADGEGRRGAEARGRSTRSRARRQAAARRRRQRDEPRDRQPPGALVGHGGGAGRAPLPCPRADRGGRAVRRRRPRHGHARDGRPRAGAGDPAAPDARATCRSSSSPRSAGCPRPARPTSSRHSSRSR